jgi:ribonuclease J
MVIPMHGEHRHLRAHRDLAEAGGRASVIAPNGTLVDITGDKPVIAGKIEAGRVYVDGRVRVGARDGVVRDRLRLARNGLLVVTMILEDDDTPIGAPWVEVIGLSETGRSGRAVSDRVEAALERLVGGLDGGVLGDDRQLEEMLTRTARKAADGELGKKPEIAVVISRLGSE